MSNTFRTIIQVEKVAQQIDYAQKLLAIGSCFTEHIGQKLQHYKFDVVINPTGIVYNPISIANSLQLLLNQQVLTSTDLLFHQERWLSLQHHGRFSHHNQGTCLAQINQATKKGYTQLKNAHVLLLTLGTAFVYQYKATGQVVANCHQLPANQFDSYSIDTTTIVKTFERLFDQIQVLNPTIKIVFTVSPIRHWKDGAVQNQYSKATLLLAIHELMNQYKNIFYFPAYEIMLDDLRDYRFYEADMIHPNQVAIDYIWQQFKEAYIEKKCWPMMKQIAQIRQSALHRPRNPSSQRHKTFVNSQLGKIATLKKQYSFFNFEEEITLLNKYV